MNLSLAEASKYANKMLSQKWVRWVHPRTLPVETSAQKNENALSASNHCGRCLNLNGCCFVIERIPRHRLHPNCHCFVWSIPQPDVTVRCAVEKFSHYIFDLEKNKGKKELFELWGYGIMDSQSLAEEFTCQATVKYQSGEYELGVLNEYGQRINIQIALPDRRTGETKTFIAGFMTYPNGRITLVTPYGDV